MIIAVYKLTEPHLVDVHWNLQYEVQDKTREGKEQLQVILHHLSNMGGWCYDVDLYGSQWKWSLCLLMMSLYYMKLPDCVSSVFSIWHMFFCSLLGQRLVLDGTAVSSPGVGIICWSWHRWSEDACYFWHRRTGVSARQPTGLIHWKLSAHCLVRSFPKWPYR